MTLGQRWREAQKAERASGRDIMVVTSGPWALFQIGKLRHPKDKLFFFMGCLLSDAGTGNSL